MNDLVQGDLFADAGGDEPGIHLARYAEQAYLDYAISVVKGRALPDLADGQKPVQRRILYAMQAMGLGSGSRPVKSARVVGDVLGKFHPHGDQAAYDALVRMAQDFTLRYPLIDGQGNFGSRDGDNAAAMRYTEARLTPIARLLLDELDQGTVDFVDNYDGSQQEPRQLPARLPMVLLNGASGIAVGMATEIPSHNLREVTRAAVTLLKKPQTSDETVAELLPGPDFAGGGHIITAPEDIAQIYASGRGTLKARARWQFEDMARGQWQLVVNELPPGTSGQRVLEEIEALTNPQVRAGKKSLTPEQVQNKARLLALLDTVRDESGKDAPVRLVFEPKTGKVDRDELVTVLLAHTSLELNVPINLVMVGNDGRPRQKTLRDILTEWLEFRFATVTRRSQHRLEKVLDRIHVLEGRMVVYLNVDEVIRVIRESDEPRPALMEAFSLTERQADDILEMRLRQLARLEAFKIEQELDKLRGEQGQLEELLNNPAAMKRLIAREMEADAKQFGDDRRTLIEAAEKAVVEVRIPDEPVTVIVSQKGWLRARQGHGHDASQFNFKAGDALYAAYECRSVDTLAVLADNGRAYSVAVASLPSARGDGAPVTSLVELEAGSRVVHMLAGPAEQRWLLSTQRGLGFVARVADMTTRRGGKQFVTLESGDHLVRPVPVPEDARWLATYSANGRMLVMDLAEVKVLRGGGRGTQLMGLDAKETLDQVVAFGEVGLRVTGVYRNKPYDQVWRHDDWAPFVGKRARKGKAFGNKPRQPQFAAAVAASSASEA